MGNLTCPFQPPQPFPSPLHISGTGLDAHVLIFAVPSPSSQTRANQETQHEGNDPGDPGHTGLLLPTGLRDVLGPDQHTRTLRVPGLCSCPAASSRSGFPCTPRAPKARPRGPGSTRTLVRQTPSKAGVKDPTQAISDVHQVLARPWSTNASQAF